MRVRLDDRQAQQVGSRHVIPEKRNYGSIVIRKAQLLQLLANVNVCGLLRFPGEARWQTISTTCPHVPSVISCVSPRMIRKTSWRDRDKSIACRQESDAAVFIVRNGNAGLSAGIDVSPRGVRASADRKTNVSVNN